MVCTVIVAEGGRPRLAVADLSHLGSNQVRLARNEDWYESCTWEVSLRVLERHNVQMLLQEEQKR